MTLSAKLEMFENRLLKVYKHRSKIARRTGITCYRLYDKDLPEFPVSIDVYDSRVCLSEYKAKHQLSEEAYELWLSGTIAAIGKVLEIDEDRIYTKERRRKTDRTAQYNKIDEMKDFFVVEENGLRFQVNLSDYLDTGLFLDHRITRKMVQEIAKGKKVLNLFAYTGSFSVYAAAGEADEVVTIDLSNTYTEWAKKNFELNDFPVSEKYKFIAADVLQYLPTLPVNYFDIIVLDPPTFSNSKKMKEFLDIQQDHVLLINQCLKLLRPGGVIFFSTNARRFELQQESISALKISEITKATTPFDFEGKLLRWCWKIEK
jgi:23S rRNA (cytosine1962-C5)-methyltransferase